MPLSRDARLAVEPMPLNIYPQSLRSIHLFRTTER